MDPVMELVEGRPSFLAKVTKYLRLETDPDNSASNHQTYLVLTHLRNWATKFPKHCMFHIYHTSTDSGLYLEIDILTLEFVDIDAFILFKLNWTIAAELLDSAHEDDIKARSKPL